ncbi:zinc finger CCCH domain-containing protein 14-like isoform X2 [Patiria miniata]|uniref:Zinc finger CCCH domain-containing protein 14 n=1 Tax=Patiria miniata TaxID=46514 RepID=A0A914BFW9_PATMI|nr:zinc finger CCCH domain-containing protein 14-like isoform X2 [Patiria miniata]
MEIGNNEMSNKIRSAIKAKLVDLGSYVDDELPDYIMVMVANKKSQTQMTDDLSLFLGNNTVTFTSWLHSILDKLTKPSPDPKPKKAKEHAAKSKKAKEKKSVASSQMQPKRSDVQQVPIQSDNTLAASSSAALSTAVQETPVATVKVGKPDPSQDVISLKPETNDFLDEELAQEAMVSEVSKKQSAVVPPIASVKEKSSFRIEKSKVSQREPKDKKSPVSPSAPVRVKVSPTLPTASRKRKAPGSVIGQVLNVEDEDSDEPASFGKKVASTVLPQRRPTLPVAKQANTSLLKKAVSAAEASTNQALTAKLQQKALKMAPRRFKIIRKQQQSPKKRNLLLKAVQEAKESLSVPRQPQGHAGSAHQRVQVEMPMTGLVSRSRIMELTERDYDAQDFITVTADPATTSQQIEEYYADDEEQDETESPDSRQICLSSGTKTELVYVVEDDNADQRVAEPVYTPTPLTSCQSEASARPVSPKFIVTLEGATHSKAKTKQRKSARVAPRLSFTRTVDNSMMYADFVELQQQQQQQQQQRQQEEEELARLQQEELALQQEIILQQRKQQLLQQQQQQQATDEYLCGDSRLTFVTRKPHLDEVEEMQFTLEEPFQEEDPSPTKKEKSTAERCMFWPACKNGSDCLYVHPTTPCRTFPNCKFGDKCLFIHPNCKYDSRCSRPNCPYTHATRKQSHPTAVSPPAVFVPPTQGTGSSHVPHKVSKVCRFHPNCSNAQCPFLHPKMCNFGRGCTRAGCSFTHPQVATGAALKWSKQTHISDRPFVAKDSSK